MTWVGISSGYGTKQQLTWFSDVKYAMAECNMAVRQYSQALTLLESIPQRHRTPKVNMRLGRLYQQAGMERPAITAYKEVLKVTAKSALAHF